MFKQVTEIIAQSCNQLDSFRITAVIKMFEDDIINCKILFLKNVENILLMKSRIEIVPLNNS